MFFLCSLPLLPISDLLELSSRVRKVRFRDIHASLKLNLNSCLIVRMTKKFNN